MTVPVTQAGHDGPRCGARKRQGDGTCTQTAGWGTDHVGFGACKLHGGSTGTQVVAAERQRIEVQARRLLADLGDAEPVTDPLGELQRLAGEILGLKNIAGRLVDGLDSLRYTAANGTEQLRAEVGVYERAVDRTERVLTSMVRLGTEERQTRLAEAQAAVVVAVLSGALDDAGVTGEVAQRVREALAVRLRAVTAGERGPAR